jgi:histidine ammonia-lyase
MGMTAAMKLKQVVRNTRYVLAMELLAAARALDCLRPLKSSPVIEKIRAELATFSQPWTADRPMAPDIERTAAWLAGAGTAGTDGTFPRF